MENVAIRRLPSASGMDVEADPYKDLRKALIKVAYNEQNKSRGRTKEAVRVMLGPLTAARKNGETFEELAGLMTRHGYPMAASTLRNYYFELRADAELKSLVREQAEVLTESRRRLVNETTQAKIQVEAASELAARRKKSGLVSRPKLLTARELIDPTSADSDDETPPPMERIRQRAPVPALSVQKPHSQENRARAQPPAAAKATAGVAPFAPSDQVDEALTPNKAPSIALLKKMAESVTNKVVLPMDVELKDGVHAYYADGSPLDLILTMRQVRLLESSGRLIATSNSSDTGNRTDKSFVKLPDKL